MRVDEKRTGGTWRVNMLFGEFMLLEEWPRAIILHGDRFRLDPVQGIYVNQSGESFDTVVKRRYTLNNMRYLRIEVDDSIELEEKEKELLEEFLRQIRVRDGLEFAKIETVGGFYLGARINGFALAEPVKMVSTLFEKMKADKWYSLEELGVVE